MGYYAEGKQVAFWGVWFFVLTAVLDHLGSHVAHGAASFVAFGCDSVVEKEGETEIDDVGFVGLHVDVYVLRFEVSMYDFIGMDIPDSFK